MSNDVSYIASFIPWPGDLLLRSPHLDVRHVLLPAYEHLPGLAADGTILHHLPLHVALHEHFDLLAAVGALNFHRLHGGQQSAGVGAAQG